MVKIKKQFLVTALVTVGTLAQSSTVFAYNPDPPVAAGSYNVVDVARNRLEGQYGSYS